jgi:hypothetical protein
MHVAAIMPCRGRPEQTVANVRRLLSTAGDVDWQLICMVDRDPDVMKALSNANPPVWIMESAQPGYWHALQQATDYWPEFDLLCGLANDLWACDDWLSEALSEYRERFGNGDGLLGIAGDGHGPMHACHFLISRALLARYGGWPTWYRHNFGDRELCARAQQDGVYAKSRRAWLEHCHVERGLAPDDAVYQVGRATFRQDEALFVERRRLGWPSV